MRSRALPRARPWRARTPGRRRCSGEKAALLTQPGAAAAPLTWNRCCASFRNVLLVSSESLPACVKN